jgi:hypothetical protein
VSFGHRHRRRCRFDPLSPIVVWGAPVRSWGHDRRPSSVPTGAVCRRSRHGRVCWTVTNAAAVGRDGTGRDAMGAGVNFGPQANDGAGFDDIQVDTGDDDEEGNDYGEGWWNRAGGTRMLQTRGPARIAAHASIQQALKAPRYPPIPSATSYERSAFARELWHRRENPHGLPLAQQRAQLPSWRGKATRFRSSTRKSRGRARAHDGARGRTSREGAAVRRPCRYCIRQGSDTTGAQSHRDRGGRSHTRAATSCMHTVT